MNTFKTGGCKVLACTSLHNNADYYSRWQQSFYPITCYLWANGAFCLVRECRENTVDRIDEDDCLELCNQYGMPDAWISSN